MYPCHSVLSPRIWRRLTFLSSRSCKERARLDSLVTNELTGEHIVRYLEAETSIIQLGDTPKIRQSRREARVIHAKCLKRLTQEISLS